MKNRNPKIVEILNKEDSFFKCKICGQVWYAHTLRGGRWAPGSWQCPNGCKAKKNN